MRNIHRNLRTGALLIFDFWYGPAVRREPPGPRQRIVEDGGERIVRLASSELDGEAETCTVSFQLRRMRGGSVIGETPEKHTLRYYDREPLRELLAASHRGRFLPAGWYRMKSSPDAPCFPSPSGKVPPRP